jgi:Family of unknown function (DUF5681)
MKNPENDYHVGYGRAPVHARFKPGQCGNPRGRPKGQKNMGALLRSVLSERIKIREGDKFRTVSRAEAAMRALVLKAMKGDVKACWTLITLSQKSGQFEMAGVPLQVIKRILVDPKTGEEKDIPI